MASRKSKNDRRKLEKRHRRLQERKRQLPDSPFGPGAILVEPEGVEKMSVVLERFVAPYRNLTTSEEAFRKLLNLAVLAWNAALLPEAKQDPVIDEVLRDGLPPLPPAEQAGVRALVKEMIDRKLAH